MPVDKNNIYNYNIVPGILSPFLGNPGKQTIKITVCTTSIGTNLYAVMQVTVAFPFKREWPFKATIVYQL